MRFRGETLDKVGDTLTTGIGKVDRLGGEAQLRGRSQVATRTAWTKTLAKWMNRKLKLYQWISRLRAVAIKLQVTHHHQETIIFHLKDTGWILRVAQIDVPHLLTQINKLRNTLHLVAKMHQARFQETKWISCSQLDRRSSWTKAKLHTTVLRKLPLKISPLVQITTGGVSGCLCRRAKIMEMGNPRQVMLGSRISRTMTIFCQSSSLYSLIDNFDQEERDSETEGAKKESQNSLKNNGRDGSSKIRRSLLCPS